MAQCLQFLIRLGCKVPAGTLSRFPGRCLLASTNHAQAIPAREVSSSKLKMTIENSNDGSKGVTSRLVGGTGHGIDEVERSIVLQSLPPVESAVMEEFDLCLEKELVLQHIVDIAKHSHFTAEQAAQLIDKVYHLAYTDLSFSRPWLQGKTAIAFVQLTINEQLTHVMEPIISHTGFQILLDTVKFSMEDFTPEDLTQTFLLLLRLGLDPTCSLSHQLLFYCRDQSMDFSLMAFSAYLEACRILHKTDTVFWHKAAQKHQQVIKYAAPGGDTAFLFAKITLNLLKILSDDVKAVSLKVLLDLIEGGPCHDDPVHLGAFLKVAHKITLQNKTLETERLRVRIAKNVLRVLREPGMIESLEPYNISEIAMPLKMCHYYPNDIRMRMQDRALELLHDNPKISDITNLLSAFTRQGLPLYVKRGIEDLLFKNIQDADVFILSNLTTTLRDLNCRKREILGLFHEQILLNKHSIMDHWTRFQKVAAHLKWNNFIKKEHQEEFQEALLMSLDKQFGINARTLAMVAGYALPNVQEKIPDKLYTKILDFLPQISLYEMYHLMHGLDKLEACQDAEVKRQVDTILSGIHDTVMERLASVDSLDCLHRLLLVLVLHRKSPDPVLSDKLINLLPRFTRGMTVTSMGKVAKMLSKLQYSQTEVMEDLAANIIANKEDMGLSHLTTVLNCLATAGYWPADWEQVAKTCMEIYARERAEVGVREKVLFAYYLARMQYFPEDLLSEIFSLDFIEDVDTHFETIGAEKKEVLETTLCGLNRIVVLEHPQMDVPWFHQQFATARLERRRNESPFYLEVKDVLSEALGGGEYFLGKAVTPYCYEIDFQCILDQDSHPVSLAEAPLKEFTLPSGYQRLAILTLPECCFCMNTRQPTGYTVMKNRHLELLGYRVLWVAHYEWNSMALASRSAKIDYIKEKILNH